MRLSKIKNLKIRDKWPLFLVLTETLVGSLREGLTALEQRDIALQTKTNKQCLNVYVGQFYMYLGIYVRMYPCMFMYISI